jgi:hypothetical protein
VTKFIAAIQELGYTACDGDVSPVQSVLNSEYLWYRLTNVLQVMQKTAFLQYTTTYISFHESGGAWDMKKVQVSDQSAMLTNAIGV